MMHGVVLFNDDDDQRRADVAGIYHVKVEHGAIVFMKTSGDVVGFPLSRVAEFYTYQDPVEDTDEDDTE